jgi:uncharacterized protein (DUF1330 family)
MSAYLIVDVEVTNPESFEKYRELAPATITKHGGRFLVRGGAKVEVLEGKWTPKGVVVIEFPSMDALKRWYDSPEYKPLRELRQASSVGNLIAVEGI